MAKFFQNGVEIGERDAKDATHRGCSLLGHSDPEEFNDTWITAKRDTDAGEEARDRIFEWSDATIEVMV